MPPSLVPEASGPGPRITGFAGRGFRIDGIVHATGALLTPKDVVAWDAPALDALVAGDVASLLALDPRPEFLLLGTGAQMAR
ncbi:MAG: Mth938-like domain-containing protein, partial [Sphingomonadaceae bacterium]